jgi:hypothetical protein
MTGAMEEHKAMIIYTRKPIAARDTAVFKTSHSTVVRSVRTDLIWTLGFTQRGNSLEYVHFIDQTWRMRQFDIPTVE